MTKFKDHFSKQAIAYARFRPRYPEALFSYLASIAPNLDLVWDCGTGNGQAAVVLAEHFRQVVASDASAEQISQAMPHPKVRYLIAPDTASTLDDASCALVTVAQAVHWFNFAAFYQEVKRVLQPGGVLAVWCYVWMRIDTEIDQLLAHFATQTLAPYWPAESVYIHDYYRNLPSFPFTELQLPSFEMQLRWDLETMLNYLRTWSAVQGYQHARGEDPVKPLARQLRELWRDGGEKAITWPLGLRAGYR